VSWSELIGFTLVDAQSNRAVGKVMSVDDSTLNVLFDVRTADERDVLVPASEELIEDIDIASQEIRMNLPEGILEI
jgi:16S rRNA processing protein RimM